MKIWLVVEDNSADLALHAGLYTKQNSKHGLSEY